MSSIDFGRLHVYKSVSVDSYTLIFFLYYFSTQGCIFFSNSFLSALGVDETLLGAKKFMIEKKKKRNAKLFMSRYENFYSTLAACLS
jgi:hypothetical protein